MPEHDKPSPQPAPPLETGEVSKCTHPRRPYFGCHECKWPLGFSDEPAPAEPPTFGKWIPVSERLPRVLTTVLIAVTNGDGRWVNTGYLAKDGIAWHEHELNGAELRFGVTHWMPLPIAPRHVPAAAPAPEPVGSGSALNAPRFHEHSESCYNYDKRDLLHQSGTRVCGYLTERRTAKEDRRLGGKEYWPS